MKKTLYIKLFFAYLLLGVIGFILVSTVSQKMQTTYTISQTAGNLYREANSISSNYAQAYYSDELTIDDLQSQLETLSKYSQAEIWFVGPKGQMLVNSADEPDSDQHEKIKNFNITDFGNQYYLIGKFYDHFKKPYLSVFSPISVNYKVRGYILIHKPISDINEESYTLLNVTYITFVLIYLCVFFFLLLFIWLVIQPIQKIAKITAQYADGNFSTKINLHSSDEIGYLAASVDYMANEMNTIEEDQRKFVSNVSHDFRSPLTSIKGYLEAILDGTIPRELQDKYLNIILFETERLNKLTNSLLELNKYGSHGKTILDANHFDINHVIRMTALTFEGRCKEKRISFELILSGKTLFVKADMSKIEQVIYNLIDNAIKFSHPDAKITLETTEKNEKVFVSVKDCGIGIPKDSLNKIWERFYKTDLSRGKDKRGTGLGLSIVREIILSHGENINVISTEGVGTEFIFTLPLSKEPFKDL